MVEDWQACATGNGCTLDQVDQVTTQCEELYPPYDLPIVRQYAQQYDAPFHGDGFALVYCEMDITHLQAAQKDARLTIFNSLEDAVNQAAVDAHAHLFDPAPVDAKASVDAPAAATPAAPSTLRDLLKELSARHVKFSASE
jgi:hypothetical protein